MTTMTERKVRINYNYQRVPTLRKFALCNKRFRAAVGPFGSGKSSAMLWEIIRRGQEQMPGPDGIRRTRWAIIRNTYPQLKDTTMRTVFAWLPSILFGRFMSADHNFIITEIGGCEIELNFRALDKEEHLGNLLSLELTGAWINESREVPRSIVNAVDGRIDRYPPMREGGATWCGIIEDTNPPDDDSEFYHFYEVNRPPNAEIFKQPSGLSPEAENIMTHEEYDMWKKGGVLGEAPGLKPDYYTNLAVGKSNDFLQVYIHGQYGFVKEGKPVYEGTWNDHQHAFTGSMPVVQGRELVIGMDFGLTPAAVFMQLTPRGFLNIYEEFISQGMGIKQFVRSIIKPALTRQEYRDLPLIISGDPAGETRAQSDAKSCFDILRSEGLKVVAARSNSLTARIGAVEGFLGRMTDGMPTFRLNADCQKLRKGFNGRYSYKRSKIPGSSGEVRIADIPLKNSYSHPHDALQYGALYFNEGTRYERKHKRRPRRSYRAPTKAGY